MCSTKLPIQFTVQIIKGWALYIIRLFLIFWDIKQRLSCYVVWTDCIFVNKKISHYDVQNILDNVCRIVVTCLKINFWERTYIITHNAYIKCYKIGWKFKLICVFKFSHKSMLFYVVDQKPIKSVQNTIKYLYIITGKMFSET